jgi:hypothetical protein
VGDAIEVRDLGINFHLNMRGRRRRKRQLRDVFRPGGSGKFERTFWAL